MNRIPFDPYDFFGYLASGLLLIVGMELVFGIPQVLGRELGVVDTAVLILAVYVAGQLVATPAKTLLEDGVVEKLLGRPSVNLFRPKKPWLRGTLFPGYYKPLPDQISRRTLSKAEKEGVKGTGEALFLHVRYSGEVLSNERLMARLNSFLSKYGFARNLAFTSIAVGIALLWKANVAPCAPAKKYAITAIVTGVLLFYRYLKFFRQYSYELFNSYGGTK